MPLLDPRHWQVTPGDTWAAIANAMRVGPVEVVRANGLHVSSGGHLPPDPEAGMVIHLPLA